MEVEVSESLRRVGLVERRIEILDQPQLEDELQAITKEIIRTMVISKYEPPKISKPQRSSRAR